MFFLDDFNLLFLAHSKNRTILTCIHEQLELQGVAREFGVQAMPTFVLIKKGRVIDKVTGVRKEELQKKIEKHKTN